MSLVKWQPFDLLHDTWQDWNQASSHELATDIYEDNGNIVVEMQVPGMDIKNISIEAHDNLLRISGHREERKEEKKKDFYHKEIRRGHFERVITLPADVKEDEAKAECSNGLLTITLPKKITKNGKKISITQK